jgi:TonB family protein
MAGAWALAARADMGAPQPTPVPVTGEALLRHWTPPVYPPDALKERLGGAVTVRMVVDEKGNVASARILDATDPRLGGAALAAAKTWVFTPALDEGKPVPVSMDAPVYFSPATAGRKAGLVPSPDQTPQASPRTPAKVGSSEPAEYPDGLLDRKLSGAVFLTCTVSPQGRAVGSRVIVSSHPDFVLPALKALDRWQFVPAMQGDLPVQADLDVKMTFGSAGSDPAAVLEANLNTGPDGSPPSLPTTPRVMVDPVLPYDQVLKGEAGTASVAFTVGEDGRVKDASVRSASAPAFASALVAAVEVKVFEAPISVGVPAPVPLVRRFDFPAIAPDSKDDSDPTSRLVAAVRAGQVGTAKGLDERLSPIYRVAPGYPLALRKAGAPPGHADIEFIIDRDGRARLPRVVSATSEEFGWAAATAVSQWIFKAPMKGGQPVDVRVRIPFDFKSPAP